MSRRQGNLTRKHAGRGCGAIALVFMGGILFLLYLRNGGGTFGIVQHLGKVKGDFPCTSEVEFAIPFLRKAYGKSLQKVLHVGPDTCSVVSTLLKQDGESKARGIEPYDVEDADAVCKGMVRKGIVRVADIKFPLPYRPHSFSLVIVSDALDYLSPKYLNQTLPDLARVSKEGLAIFTGNPSRLKGSEVKKIATAAKWRSSSWWQRYFIQTSLEENEDANGRFEKLIRKAAYKPTCQIFHLKSKS